MGLAAYEIIGSAGEWRVKHDGKAENVYQTKEAAFEAAVAAAPRTPARNRNRFRRYAVIFEVALGGPRSDHPIRHDMDRNAKTNCDDTYMVGGHSGVIMD